MSAHAFTAQSGARLPGRRLADKLVAAFQQACDQNDLSAARAVQTALDIVARRQAPSGIDRRGGTELRIATQAYERLRLMEFSR